MKLSSGTLIAYAAPNVALQAIMVALLLYLPPVYSQVGGLTLTVVGVVFALGRAFEAFSDPIIGALSDRTKSSFGRRRIWMVIGVPIVIPATWFLLTPDPGTSALYLLLWLIVFYVGWTFVFIPYQSWGGEISADYDERTRIAGFRETGAFVGYLCASVVPLLYWTLYLGVDRPSFEQIVHAVGVFFAVALPLAVMWCLGRVPPVAPAQGAAHPSWSELFAILRRNKPFARLMIAYFFDRLAMGTYFFAQPLLIMFALDMPEYLIPVALVISVSAVVFAPLWVPASRRLGKHRTYCIANLITIAAYVLLFVAGKDQVLVVFAAMVIMGLGNGGTMITPPAMTADAADHDELQSGAEQMGGHVAFLAFVFKSGMAFGPVVGGFFLAIFGYERAGQALDSTTTLGIELCASWLPAVLLLVPLVLMWNFPIDAKRHAEIRRQLDARKSAGAGEAREAPAQTA